MPADARLTLHAGALAAGTPGPDHTLMTRPSPHLLPADTLGGDCANATPVSMFFCSTGLSSATPFSSSADSGPRPSTSSTPLGPRRTCARASLSAPCLPACLALPAHAASSAPWMPIKI